MNTGVSILILQGDAEAKLLANAELAVQAVVPDKETRVTRAWAVRPDWLDAAASAPPAPLRERGLIDDADARKLLEQTYDLVLFSFLPLIAMPALRHRSGGSFIAHDGVRATWTPCDASMIAEECTEELPLSARDAACSLEKVIDRLHSRGSRTAVTMAFRHVLEPLAHRRVEGAATRRELVRQANLEVARLSQRTGCFVFDLDRPLAHEGGARLAADCQGGADAAAEIALEEFAALVLDAELA